MTELKLTFDPMTIEHLGFKMYSHLPNAVAELVANSYDADATRVSVILSSSDDSITIEDDGHGMSLSELQDNYLRIGRNRREATSSDFSESGRRKAAGRKGLGKLSVFGIGNTIIVETKRAGANEYAEVTMVWSAIKESSGNDYKPKVQMRPADPSEHFTRIRIEDLTRTGAVNARLLAEQLSRLFNYSDADFLLDVQKGNDRITVDRDLRYESIASQAEWTVPADFRTGSSRSTDMPIRGKIIASKRPLPAHLRGITLYVRGRMANEPEFFGVPDSSHAYAYLTGFVDVDDLDNSADVISTDRRSVSWDSEAASSLQERLASIVREAAAKRRTLREQENKSKVQKDAGVDVDAWTATIRGPEAEAVKEVITTLVSPDNDIDDIDREKIVTGLRRIAPEYADLHWRALHPAIQDAAESEYKSGNFHHAVTEAIKQYVEDVRSLAGKGNDVQELQVLRSAFSHNEGRDPSVDIAQPYLSHGISRETKKNIREAHKVLSEAAWTGFRNPIQHELVKKLQDSGLFTYQDCLDALSLVSHLRRRIGALEASSGEGDI